MKQLTIRGVSDALAQALDNERRRRGVSLNQAVLDLLRQAVRLGPDKPADNGLSRFAGTWSDKDLREFEKNTASFEQIDEDHWK
jgi:hypothetical protein